MFKRSIGLRLLAKLTTMLLMLIALGTCYASPAEKLTVAWATKPPFLYQEAGVEKGSLLTLARQVFSEAKIDVKFVNEPIKRIVFSLQRGAKNYCSVGWYHLPGRQKWAQFSEPLYRHLPQVVLVAPNALSAVNSHMSLASLMADRSLSIGVIDGASYGEQLDLAIKESENHVLRRTIDEQALVDMVAAGRFSYTFIDAEDWNYLRDRQASLRRVVQRDFSDMPRGLNRHIVCGKGVSPEVMARINKAIQITVYGEQTVIFRRSVAN